MPLVTVRSRRDWSRTIFVGPLSRRETSAGWPHAAWRPTPIHVTDPPEALDFVRRRFSTAIWATGYRRLYPWLHVPALDDRGEIAHRQGIARVPGLYVLGLKFQRRRASHLIGRVGADAAFLARRIVAA